MNGATKAIIGRAALAKRIPMDMPMVGKLVRESRKRKHRYVLTLKFKHSRRHYVDEVIYAVTKKDALKVARRMFPSATIK
jgi:hypothetical protein